MISGGASSQRNEHKRSSARMRISSKLAKYYSVAHAHGPQYYTAVCVYKEHKKSMFCLVKGDKPSRVRACREERVAKGRVPFAISNGFFFPRLGVLFLLLGFIITTLNP